MIGCVRTVRAGGSEADAAAAPRPPRPPPGPIMDFCPVRRSYTLTFPPYTRSGFFGSGAASPYSSMPTGCQSWKVISPSMPRLSTHAEPESCWPLQSRYGNALSAVTWYIAAVGWLYQLLQDSPRLLE